LLGLEDAGHYGEAFWTRGRLITEGGEVRIEGGRDYGCQRMAGDRKDQASSDGLFCCCYLVEMAEATRGFDGLIRDGLRIEGERGVGGNRRRDCRQERKDALIYMTSRRDRPPLA
jgi:hypothetical protein